MMINYTVDTKAIDEKVANAKAKGYKKAFITATTGKEMKYIAENYKIIQALAYPYYTKVTVEVK